jgi:hypothetical protein
MVNDDNPGTIEEFKFQGCYVPPPLQKSHPKIMSPEGVTKERDYNASLWKEKIWIIRTQEILGLLHGFFFRMAAPLNLIEANHPSPHDPILLT